MYSKGITSLLQTSKTAKSRLKTSLMIEFQLINDVKYLYSVFQLYSVLLGRNTRLKLVLSRLVKGRSVLNLECEPCMIVQQMET